MPCYTLVTIRVRDRAAAVQTLQALQIAGTVEAVPNSDEFTIALNDDYITDDFRQRFLQEYGVQVAISQAAQAGYTAERAFDASTGNIELVLQNAF
jgi:predicted NBD/HSP70 family sugar kinase